MANAVKAYFSGVARLRQIVRPKLRIDYRDCEVNLTSPFVIWFGSFDLFVELTIWPGILDGSLDKLEMIDIVAALRRWEDNRTWDRAVVE